MISVVAPVYNEAEVIEEFHRRTVAAMEAIGDEFELVYVDDGSTDTSGSVLRTLAEADPRVRVLLLSRNFGHQLAITAGIEAARGEAVVVIDADLQDPPEVIADMVTTWRQGHEVVYGVRTDRPGESRLKLFTARWFYRVISKLSDIDLPPDAGDFRLLDRKVVDVLSAMPEDNRYVRGMVAWVGFRQVGLPYERDARHGGETKFTFTTMWRFAFDAITSFSERPLRLAVQLGSLVTMFAFLYTAWIVISRIVDPSRSIAGFASLMAAVLFLGGVQLLVVGILGTYLGRTYREVKHRPLYVVAERLGPGS